MPRVLVADDDRFLRDAARSVLEDEGYEIVEAEHGAAALEVLRNTDERMVVLLDIVMPHMSGVDVLTLVGGDERLARHAYVIWAASRVPLPTELLTALAMPVVSKPFDLDVLLKVIAESAERLQREESALDGSSCLPAAPWRS